MTEVVQGSNELQELVETVLCSPDLQIVESLTLDPPVNPSSIPPHRTHDPALTAKRTDPFQFGQRTLAEDDNVFEFNAWDHVETDDAYKKYAETQIAKQREAPVSEFDKNRFNSDPAKWWNKFYKNNTGNFFKDRKWLRQEFPIINEATRVDAGPKVILEVGAGAGNTAFPILAENANPQLRLHACDYSKVAVSVMRQDPMYAQAGDTIRADVWDACGTDLPPDVKVGSVDIIIMIFIFSALQPTQWKQAVHNAHRLLRPGGVVLFRDYGRGDLAQVRFKSGRYLDNNFYVRGDGTRVYFFDRDELAGIWTGFRPTDETIGETTDPQADEQAITTTTTPYFEILDLAIDNRLLVNRKTQLKMYRCWLQGRFRKIA